MIFLHIVKSIRWVELIYLWWGGNQKKVLFFWVPFNTLGTINNLGSILYCTGMVYMLYMRVLQWELVWSRVIVEDFYTMFGIFITTTVQSFSLNEMPSWKQTSWTPFLKNNSYCTYLFYLLSASVRDQTRSHVVG